MQEIYKSPTHKEVEYVSNGLFFSPAVFLRRAFSITSDSSFCNDIHWPNEKEDDYIIDKNISYLDKEFNNLVALRTYEGEGILVLSNKTFHLGPNTLIIFRHHQPRMHYCSGKIWKFDWFEFHCGELPIILETALEIPFGPKEKFCVKNLFNKKNSDILTQGYFSFLLTILISKLPKKSMASSFDLDKCIAYIDNNLHENINVEALAQLLHLSTRYFRKIFIAKYGIPPKKYIENKRWEKVSSLLSNTNFSLDKICEKTGFTSPYYLSIRFKEHFGVSPLKYRKMNRTKN